MRMSQAFSTPDTIHGDSHGQGQQEPVDLNSEPLHWRGLQLPLRVPQGFQPQLRRQTTLALDWEQWRITAKVTVMPQEATIHNSAHKTHAVAAVSPGGIPSATCPALKEDLASAYNQNINPESQGYSVRVNNVTLGTLPDRQTAENVAAQIRQAIATVEERPTELEPLIGEGTVNAQIDEQTVFRLTEKALPADTPDAALTATAWVNNLRSVFEAPALDLAKTQMVAQGLGETDQIFRGTASWYGPYFHGRITATGEVFDQHELTAAHKTLPFGTKLKVRNLLNDKAVVVRINDRGPYIGDRSLDLSYAAAQCLDSEIVGVIPYEATILEPGVPTAWRLDTALTAQP